MASSQPMSGAERFACSLAVLALTALPVASPRQVITPDYQRLLEEYADGDPDKALVHASLYELSTISRYLYDIERGRTSGFSRRDLMMAALLHFEAALRVPAEYGAALVRVHLRAGSLLARRLYERGERAVFGDLMVAAYRPLINELPIDVLRYLSDARRLLPDETRISMVTVATLENLALLLRDPQQRIGASHPCSPSILHCLAQAELIYTQVVERVPGTHRRADAVTRRGYVVPRRPSRFGATRCLSSRAILGKVCEAKLRPWIVQQPKIRASC